MSEFIGTDVPPYAILSHTWALKGEVSFQDLQSQQESVRSKTGWNKIAETCHYAKKNNIGWAWVDTCCIDKKSSAELSEAINSMFKWYAGSEVCYVYLADVHCETAESESFDSSFGGSRWFTRGWTLQELIAPCNILFFNHNWMLLGDKTQLRTRVVRVTNIHRDVIVDPSKIHDFSVAQKMSWAVNRQTTRLEDKAYSLIGVFNVNMPMIYGEGTKAFARLQEEIIRTTNDLSILAWRQSPSDPRIYRGILAESPDEFGPCHNTSKCTSAFEFSVTNNGLRVKSQLREPTRWRHPSASASIASITTTPGNEKESNVVPYESMMVIRNTGQDEYFGVSLVKYSPDLYVRTSNSTVLDTGVQFSRVHASKSIYLATRLPDLSSWHPHGAFYLELDPVFEDGKSSSVVRIERALPAASWDAPKHLVLQKTWVAAEVTCDFFSPTAPKGRCWLSVKFGVVNTRSCAYGVQLESKAGIIPVGSIDIIEKEQDGDAENVALIAVQASKTQATMTIEGSQVDVMVSPFFRHVGDCVNAKVNVLQISMRVRNATVPGPKVKNCRLLYGG